MPSGRGGVSPTAARVELVAQAAAFPVLARCYPQSRPRDVFVGQTGKCLPRWRFEVLPVHSPGLGREPPTQVRPPSRQWIADPRSVSAKARLFALRSRPASLLLCREHRAAAQGELTRRVWHPALQAVFVWLREHLPGATARGPFEPSARQSVQALSTHRIYPSGSPLREFLRTRRLGDRSQAGHRDLRATEAV